MYIVAFNLMTLSYTISRLYRNRRQGGQQYVLESIDLRDLQCAGLSPNEPWLT